MNTLAKILIVTGVLVAIAGFIILLADKIPSFSFRLPGDILIKRNNFVFYFPLGLCILISILLTILLRLFR